MVHPIWTTYPEIEEALKDVKVIIKDNLSPIHPEISSKIIDYVDSPGKYIRAGLCLYFARMVDGEIGKGKTYIASAIEVMHLATLIHDDVIDHAEKRRGISGLHISHSNRIAIYTGDYLFAYAARLFSKGVELIEVNQEDKRLPFNSRLAEGILAGELAQLMNQFKVDMSAKDYLKQIRGKTALLFGLATQAGSYHHGISDKVFKSSFRVGESIGMAFQLSDDLLDFQSSNHDMGKPAMQDIQNGIYTYPVIVALKKSKSLVELLENHLNQMWTEKDLEKFYHELESTQALDATDVLISRNLDKMEFYYSKISNDSHSLKDFRIWLEKLMSRKF